MFMVDRTKNYDKMKFGILLAILLTVAVTSEACSCMPEHPQVLFCKAGFAIKAYIREKEDVYVHGDGSIEVIPDENKKEKEQPREGDVESPEIEKDEPEVVTEDGEGDETRPAPVIDGVAVESQPLPEEPDNGLLLDEILTVNGGGPDAASSEVEDLNGEPVDVSPPEALEPEAEEPGTGNEILGHSITTSSKAHSEALVDLKVEDKGEVATLVRPSLRETEVAAAYRPPAYIATYRGPEGAMPGRNERFEGTGRAFALRSDDNGPPAYPRSSKVANERYRRGVVFPGDRTPGSHIPSGATGKGVRMTRYTVQVTRVLKGDITNGTAYVFTPPSSPMCRMDLNLRTRYLLLGKVRDSRLHINYCDYKIDLGMLGREQARNLVGNMKHRFKRGCGNCTVSVCRSGDCTSQIASPRHCLWRNIYTVMSGKSSQFACIRLKTGRCGWYNAHNKNMTPEDLDIVESP